MRELAETITERRRQTRNSIYQYIYKSETSVSKQEISNALSLSMPTVHQNIAELLEAKLISHGQVQESTGGRRAVGLTIVKNARFAVGISVTENRLRYLAIDLKAGEIAYKKIAHHDWQTPEELIEVLKEELEIFLDEKKLKRERLLGVGVAFPGMLDVKRQAVIKAPTLKMKHIVVHELESKLPYPSYVENDGTSGGYAEWFSQVDKKSIAYLSLENGVGGAVLVNGAPYLGDNRRSGEFGHMCVESNGLMCKCGRKGCLEAYCSAARISDDLGISLEEFFADLQSGNEKYKTIWNDVLSHMAKGIVNIRMALDCDVVLGGSLSEFMEPYLEDLKQLVIENSLFDENANYVKLCSYPKRAVMMGVALYFVSNFIEEL